MVLEGTGRYTRYEGSRHTVYLPASVANDSAFPLRSGEPLRVRIDRAKRRIILEPLQPPAQD